MGYRDKQLIYLYYKEIGWKTISNISDGTMKENDIVIGYQNFEVCPIAH
jgi:hypothetical protein